MTTYVILNTENDKAYIGQTIQEEYTKRWATHKHYLRNDKHHSEYLQRSWNKYGEDAFEFKVLEEGYETIDELNDAEEFWITSLDTYYNGYNCNFGGNNTFVSEEQKEKVRYANSKPIIQYDLDGKFIKIHDSTDLASKEVGCSLHNITTALSGRTKTAKGYQWRYLTDESKDIISPIQPPNKRRGRKGKKNNLYGKKALNRQEVYQYDLNDKFIKRFDCIKDAESETGVNRSGITRTCTGEYNKSGGFKWSYQKLT